MNAAKEFPKLKNNALFLSGIMLYWAEGDNNLKNGNVRLTNTDPRMIRIFVKFAIKICKIFKKDIRIALILYPDLNERGCMDFWSKYLRIPIAQFYKTQYIKGKHPTKRLQRGICMVRIGATGLKEKVLVWIDLFAKSLMRV